MVKAAPSGSTGIYIQQTAFFYYAADVGVPADQHAGLQLPDQAGGQHTVSGMFAGDVKHQYGKALHMKKAEFGCKAANFRSVDVAINGTQNAGGAPGLENFHRTCIAGMPYFPAIGKLFNQLRIKPAVGIAVNSDAVNVFHVSAAENGKATHAARNDVEAVEVKGGGEPFALPLAAFPEPQKFLNVLFQVLPAFGTAGAQAFKDFIG